MNKLVEAIAERGPQGMHYLKVYQVAHKLGLHQKDIVEALRAGKIIKNGNFAVATQTHRKIQETLS